MVFNKLCLKFIQQMGISTFDAKSLHLCWLFTFITKKQPIINLHRYSINCVWSLFKKCSIFNILVLQWRIICTVLLCIRTRKFRLDIVNIYGHVGGGRCQVSLHSWDDWIHQVDDLCWLTCLEVLEVHTH
mgnify:CR=1 FL=1